MSRIRYLVAMSLDGYIGGPEGEADWILMDPDIDFRAIYGQFETVIMGRRTYEPAKQASGGGAGMLWDMETIVVSRTLRQEDHPEVTIVGEDYADRLGSLRAESSKDIWLFGGGTLFRSLAEDGLVDTVEVAVIPVLLGGGIPLLPPPTRRVPLKLTGHRIYEKSGIVSFEYTVNPAS